MSDANASFGPIERAVDDLRDDFDRQGGVLFQNQVERLFEKRKLSVSECTQIIQRLEYLGIAIGPVSLKPKKQSEQSPSPSKTLKDTSTEDFVDADKKSASKNEYWAEYQALTDHYNLGKDDFLSSQQELECIRQVQLYKRLCEETGEDLSENPELKAIAKSGQKAQKRLIVSNIRFIIKVSKQFIGVSSLTLGDLVQEGIAGMIRAIEKFDLGYENRFQTYAVWWVKQNIMRAITDQGPMIRLPVNIVSEIGIYRRAYKLLSGTHPERPPTLLEIAEELMWDRERVAFIRDISSFQFESGLKNPNQDSTESLLDTIADQTAGPDEFASEENVKSLIRDALSELDDRERQVVELSFGLTGDERESTLRDIGERFGISHERVRQIKGSVLNKLRKRLGPIFGKKVLNDPSLGLNALVDAELKIPSVRDKKKSDFISELNISEQPSKKDGGDHVA
jgi:RNA polymerase primary sigma factor